MVGADPNGGEFGCVRAKERRCAPAYARLRRAVVVWVLLPLSLCLAQCSRAPNAGALAANAHPIAMRVADSATFDERFPAPQFNDRFPRPNESLLQRRMSDFAQKPVAAAQAEPVPYRVA